MARGGKREGAGRKSEWRHRETTVIRVPKIFASHLIETAKKLDQSTALELVTNSKEDASSLSDELLAPPGQMLIFQEKGESDLEVESVIKSNSSSDEIVTDSNESAIEIDTESYSPLQDSVTNSDDWMSMKECWTRLGEPSSYDTFRKLNPEKLRQLYGVDADLSRKEKGRYGSRWLRIAT